jgi:hypothetical protein
MIKASIGHLFRWRDESVTFSRIFENLESAYAIDQLAEMAPVLVGGERALSRCHWSGPEGCVENGPAAAWQLSDPLRIDSDMRPPSASPARTALQAAYFECNDVTIICETVH